MADVYSTDNIGKTRAGDIKQASDVKPVKKVAKKKARMRLRERPQKKRRKGNKPGEDDKKHIDVYA